MSSALIVAVFGGGTIGGIVIAILNGFIFKKRTGAEAAELIQRAASGLTTSISEQFERVVEDRKRDREQFEESRRKWEDERSALIESWDRERADRYAVLQLHVSWDMLAYTAITKAGIIVPEPPPLLPPHG